MSSPVQMSDLDLTTTANDADLTLIRKSDTTDYKVTVQVLRNINIPGLPGLPAAQVFATDLLIVSQGGLNCKCQFGTIGVTKGTKMWFYSSVVPVAAIFWTIVPGTGDTLLAVKGSGVYSGGGNVQGTWQQTNTTLTINQIPSHNHIFKECKEPSHSSNDLGPCRGKIPDSDSTGVTRSTGGGQGHNHGNTWRPLASVGLICQKST